MVSNSSNDGGTLVRYGWCLTHPTLTNLTLGKNILSDAVKSDLDDGVGCRLACWHSDGIDITNLSTPIQLIIML